MQRLGASDVVFEHAENVVDPHVQFTQWCVENKLSPHDYTSYLRYEQFLQAQLRVECEQSFVQSAPLLNFGGADGGGGYMTIAVEGEHLGHAVDSVGDGAVIAPLSDTGYFNVLRNRLGNLLPPNAVFVTERGDKGSVIRVQGEHQRLILPEVERRPHLDNNIETVTVLSGGQYADLLDRKHGTSV